MYKINPVTGVEDGLKERTGLEARKAVRVPFLAQADMKSHSQAISIGHGVDGEETKDLWEAGSSGLANGI